MNLTSREDDAVLDLIPGDLFTDDPRAPLWQLESGALGLHDGDLEPSHCLVGLSLPGDLVGVECLVDALAGTAARALVPSRLRALGGGATEDRTALLARALLQSHRQRRDNVRLRCGPVAERIKHLLLLLSTPAGVSGRGATPENTPCALPSLRDMAAVVDSAPETVSRVLGSLRRLDVLHDRKPKSVCFNRLDLGQLKTLPGMTSSYVSLNRSDMQPGGWHELD